MSNGNSNPNNRTNRYRVRPVCECLPADGPIAYDIPFGSIIEAFDDCIRAKRSATDCLAFFARYEAQLVRLWTELRSGTYRPRPSKCFVVTHPVRREVFAADFADRVVHHWWALRVNPLLEQLFTEQDNVSKNCRCGEGTLSAVRAVAAMVGAHPQWWIARFDFEGFFMNIDKAVLWEMADTFIRDRYRGADLDAVLFVTRTLIFHSPQQDCIRRSPPHLWRGIPPRKTLFAQPPGRGCAIGNLPSQLLANFLASAFDEWVRRQGVRHYVRFVDDFVILLPTCADILRLVPQMRAFLWEQLRIRLHPKKVYIQPASRGVLFVGAYIQPARTYIGNRTRARFVCALHRFNRLAEAGQAAAHAEAFACVMNSYIGMMRHHRSYNIRRRLLRDLHPAWWRFITLEGHFLRIIVKRAYRRSEQMRQAVRSGAYVRMLTPELF